MTPSLFKSSLPNEASPQEALPEEETQLIESETAETAEENGQARGAEEVAVFDCWGLHWIQIGEKPFLKDGAAILHVKGSSILGSATKLKVAVQYASKNVESFEIAFSSGRETEVGDKISRRLYVGGFPYSTTEDELEKLFSACGTVESLEIKTDRFTGQSRGFAFVDMGSKTEAQRAIKTLNGTEFKGRTLVVSEARPQEKPYRYRW